MKNPTIIVIGAGFAGSVIAERLANKYNLNVQIYEQRSVLGGNMFDYYDSNGFLIQKYGPHILFTNKTDVIDYLSSFDKLVPHDCVMMSYLDGQYIQLPFNFKSVCQLIGYQKASAFITHMRELYQGEQRVSVYELMNSKNEEISSFAKLLYSKAFEPYIAKMWGLLPNQIDKSVINRVKFCPGYSTRYLDRDFQFLPSKGFTVLMSKMTKSPKIKITYSTDGCSKIKFDGNYIVASETHQRIPVIYSGSIDRLFNYCYGHLPYRSLITKVNYFIDIPRYSVLYYKNHP
jgi:UDP-galactopyranose mutase